MLSFPFSVWCHPFPSILSPSLFNILPLPCYPFPFIIMIFSLPYLIYLFPSMFDIPSLLCYLPPSTVVMFPLPCYPFPSTFFPFNVWRYPFPIHVSFPFQVILSLLCYPFPSVLSFPFHIWCYCFPSLSHYPFKPNLQPEMRKKLVQRRNIHTHTHTYRTIRQESNCGPATLLRLSSCTCLTFAECCGVKIAHAFLYAAVTQFSCYLHEILWLCWLSNIKCGLQKMVRFCQSESK